MAAKTKAADKYVAYVSTYTQGDSHGIRIYDVDMENGRFQAGDPVTQLVVREYLDPLVGQGIDTLILGCTHYPLLMDIIQQNYPDLQLISSSGAAAQALYESLEKDGMLSDDMGGRHRFFVSDDAAGVEDVARLFMGRELRISVEQVDVDV